MCGINGFNFKDSDLIRRMSLMTSQRGPDNEGFFVSEKYSAGHNRLAIIDPQTRSNQPYIFKNLVLSFNGEIYNFKELKEDLIKNGYKFDTNSDSEVIIKLFDFEGKESFKKLSGIFAISLYDKQKEELYLIRDVVGVKPLYYHFNNIEKKFYFSSLIKPLLLTTRENNLNKFALLAYSNFNRNDGKETFFKGIFKLLPGELLILKDDKLNITKFLQFNFKKTFLKDTSKIINKNFLNQFISDVPVALSLSGGTDSNIILQELLKFKGTNFQSYSVKYENSKKFSEDYEVACKIAKHYSLKINSVEVKPEDFSNYAEKIVDIVEEPMGNTNSISNYILSENITEKVVFSGDGGDEVFTGYDRYKSIFFISLISKINPFKNYKLIFSNKNMNRIFMSTSKELFLSFSEQNLFSNNGKVYKNFEQLDTNRLNKYLNHTKNITKLNLSNVMYHDIDTWVTNDILLRNDKIYANNAIETRVPFLDNNIIENFLMTKDYQKFGFFIKNKKILHNAYKDKLKMTTKKKLGFNSPFASWLRKELFDFATQILSKDYYNSNHFIDLDECQKLLKKHKEKYEDPFLIWSLISLQIFLRKYKF